MDRNVFIILAVLGVICVLTANYIIGVIILAVVVPYFPDWADEELDRIEKKTGTKD